MPFYDRPADRQTHAHALGFCCKERVEDAINTLWIDSHPGVFNCDNQLIKFIYVALYPQNPRTIHYGTHCVNGVHYQIYEYLLQVDSIG